METEKKKFPKQAAAAEKRIRDNSGQFLPGNPGGPGPIRNKERYLGVMMRECTLERWSRITIQAIEQAEKGNDKAREWLSKYLLPRATGAPSGPLVELNFGSPIPTDAQLDTLRESRIRQILAQVSNATVIETESDHEHSQFIDVENSGDHHQGGDPLSSSRGTAIDVVDQPDAEKNRPEVLTSPQPL